MITSLVCSSFFNRCGRLMFAASRDTLLRSAGRCRRAPRSVLILVACLWSGVFAARAQAYPWMIRHDHNGCAQCHMDPSGSGLLTAYGREQGDEELPMRYGSTVDSDDARRSQFLWGLLPTPEWLLLGAGVRAAALDTKIVGTPQGQANAAGAQWKASLILMQADLRAGIRAGGFRASASLGAVNDNSYAAVAGNLVSREHWVGYSFNHDGYVLRAGRLNVPFGIRSIEHTLLVRQETRTDINDTQQHGLAFAYNSQVVRGELMAILGNYQISPDSARQRGYSATVEAVPRSGVAIGASSLVTHVAQDFQLRQANLRQAHGLFARVSPVVPLVILAEGDLVINSPARGATAKGFATMLQGDVEPLQGLHFIVTGETGSAGQPGTGSAYGGWAAIDWFCLRRVDLRLDATWHRMTVGADRLDMTALLLQAHLYL